MLKKVIYIFSNLYHSLQFLKFSKAAPPDRRGSFEKSKLCDMNSGENINFFMWLLMGNQLNKL